MSERYRIKLNDDKLLKGISTKEREKLATTTKNVNILKELAEGKSSKVREYVAQNKNTPVDVLRQLAKDEDDVVRWEVAQNPNTPVDVLKILAEDRARWLREEVKKILKSRGVELESVNNVDLSKLSSSQIRNKIFKGSKESRIEALKYALDNINKFDISLFELVAELNVPYLNDVLETHPNTPDELFE